MRIENWSTATLLSLFGVGGFDGGFITGSQYPGRQAVGCMTFQTKLGEPTMGGLKQLIPRP